METSDNDAFVEAQDYSSWLLSKLKEPLGAFERAYILHLVECGNLLTSAEEEVDDGDK